MSILHSAECEQYLLAGEQIPAIAAMAAEFRSMSDPEIWAVFYERLEEDHGTAVEPFLLGLFHLLTPEISVHILIKEADPDHPGDYRYRLECPGRPSCDGWIECREPHVVDGRDADAYNEGPYDTDPTAPWFDTEEFEFHGVQHTYRYPFGWTVPYSGCVVLGHEYFTETASDLLHDLPAGSYPVRDTWREEEMELNLLTPEVKQ